MQNHRVSMPWSVACFITIFPPYCPVSSKVFDDFLDNNILCLNVITMDSKLCNVMSASR